MASLIAGARIEANPSEVGETSPDVTSETVEVCDGLDDSCHRFIVDVCLTSMEKMHFYPLTCLVLILETSAF